MPPMTRHTGDPKVLGWGRIPDIPGRGASPRLRSSGQRDRYVPGDPRVDPTVCHHTQYLDVAGSRSMVDCLDCGSRLDVSRDWAIITTVPALSDADLISKRRWHNDIWFDKNYKINMNDPDDPAEDAKANARIKAEGKVRL